MKLAQQAVFTRSHQMRGEISRARIAEGRSERRTLRRQAVVIVNQSTRRPVENKEEQHDIHTARQTTHAIWRACFSVAGHRFEHYVTVGFQGTLEATIDVPPR